MKTAAQDNVNRRYASMPGKISQSMAARGFGSSGNFGNSMYASDFQRSGDLSDLDAQFAQMGINQQNQGASIAQQMLAMTRGSTTTGTGPSTALSDGFQSGGNALSNLGTLFTLQKLLKGGGGGGGGSGVYSSGDFSNTNYGG